MNEKRTQVAGQCKVIAALCSQIAEVYKDQERLFREGHMDVLLDQVGKRSAALMEHLGDTANGMDIVEPGDEWMSPIFEGAHTMFPVSG